MLHMNIADRQCSFPCLMRGQQPCLSGESGVELSLDALQVGVKYGLPTMSPVDDAGLFTKEAGPSFQGKAVLGDGNSAVLEALAKTNHLLKVSCYTYVTAVAPLRLQRR